MKGYVALSSESARHAVRTGRPYCARPASQAPLRCSFSRPAAELAPFTAFTLLGQLRQVSLRTRVSFGTRAADCPVLLGGAEGIARPAPHAGLRVGLTPSPLPGEGRGEGQCHTDRPPAAGGAHRAANRCRRAAQRSRQRACRRTGAPRELTRRSCLNGANAVRAVSSATAGFASSAGKPRSGRQSFERPGAYRPPPRPNPTTVRP